MLLEKQSPQGCFSRLAQIAGYLVVLEHINNYKQLKYVSKFKGLYCSIFVMLPTLSYLYRWRGAFSRLTVAGVYWVPGTI